MKDTYIYVTVFSVVDSESSDDRYHFSDSAAPARQ